SSDLPAKLFISRWDAKLLSNYLGAWDVVQAPFLLFYLIFSSYWVALRTRFCNGGQSPIRASNSSPAQMGPTPDGVPVRITSPGRDRKFWLANDTISAGE